MHLELMELDLGGHIPCFAWQFRTCYQVVVGEVNMLGTKIKAWNLWSLLLKQRVFQQWNANDGINWAFMGLHEWPMRELSTAHIFRKVCPSLLLGGSCIQYMSVQDVVTVRRGLTSVVTNVPHLLVIEVLWRLDVRQQSMVHDVTWQKLVLVTADMVHKFS